MFSTRYGRSRQLNAINPRKKSCFFCPPPPELQDFGFPAGAATRLDFKIIVRPTRHNSRASPGSASSKPSIIGVLAERHARHLAERAQTLQDALKPMHTDPSTIWVICYQRTTQEPFPPEEFTRPLHVIAADSRRAHCRPALFGPGADAAPTLELRSDQALITVNQSFRW